MDKFRNTKPDGSEQASKPSGPTNTVLNVLKRFRSKREEAVEAPNLEEEPGEGTGPLARRVSELSSRIEASRAQVSDANPDRANTAEPPDGVDPTGGGSGSHRNRVRAMVFHNPAFPAKAPEKPEDPDFTSSTEPPPVKIFDAPEGVMENSGAPERRLTAPRGKSGDPIDLQAFAEQLRAKLPPKPEPETERSESSRANAEDLESKEMAAAFKKDFYNRLSKASTTFSFDAPPPLKEAEETEVSSPLRLRTIRGGSAGSALRNWREHQIKEHPSSGDAPKTADNANPAETDDATHAATDFAATAPGAPVSEYPALNDQDETPQGAVPAPEAPVFEQNSPNFADDTERGGDYQPPFAASVRLASDEAPNPDRELPESEGPAVAAQFIAQDPIPAPKSPEDLATDTSGPEATEDTETPVGDAAGQGGTNPEPSVDVTVAAGFDIAPAEDQSVKDDIPTSNDRPSDLPENVFEALDIDEAEIMAKVYDLIQTELQSAWGENITLNIRKMVRDEVRAALTKSRSDL